MYIYTIFFKIIAPDDMQYEEDRSRSNNKGRYYSWAIRDHKTFWTNKQDILQG